jgi:hypothetical protein
LKLNRKTLKLNGNILKLRFLTSVYCSLVKLTITETLTLMDIVEG